MNEVRNPNRKAAVGPAFPEAYQQFVGLSRLVGETEDAAGLDPKLIELIKIRASQLNGCALCLDMHPHDARQHGQEECCLYVLPAWRETTLFTEQERAALALTEALTTLSQHQDLPDDMYGRAAEVFMQRQLTVVVWAAATVINTFNRVGVAGRVPLPARA